MIWRRLSMKLIGIALIFTTASLIQLSVGISRAPFDHLVPPPLPTPQHLTHSKAPNYAQAQSETRVIPLHDTSSTPEANGNDSGFMTRIARWFGFGSDDSAREQQLTSGTYLSSQYSKLHNEQPYNYPNPHDHQQNGKAPCNLCNKYPWVPMWPLRAQYQQQPLWGSGPQQQQQNLDAQASQTRPQIPQTLQLYPTLSGVVPTSKQQHQQLPIKQRAVQFNFPNSNSFKHHSSGQQSGTGPYSQVPFIPIPLPNLSASAIPPLYNAKPFRPLSTQSTKFTEQQLPTTEKAHFTENIGAHSELQPDRVIPTQAPSTTNKKDSSFEIVRSHQLTDFVSSVEYPTTYVQSPAIDLDLDLLPPNHKPDVESASTVNYQREYLSPNLNHHIPASQILTELGSFGVAQHQQQTTAQIFEQTTASFYTPQFEAQSLVLNSHQREHEPFYDASGADNFPSASSHNLTQIQSNELYYTTTEPSINFELSTQAPYQSETEFITERSQATTIEFVPSLQTNIYFQQTHQNQQQLQKQQHINANLYQHKKPKDRGTPKRLLDAPIYHADGNRGSPRPFTRDPSELDFRLGPVSLTLPHPEQHPNHAYIDVQQLSATPPPPHLVSSAASPTPTSTYGAIDASGQFAGMSPPASPVTHTTKGVHQIVIPYTTKNRPRPFEPTRTVEAAFEKWAHTNSVELHEQQESKLVNSATEVPPSTRRTTKYLTKILASNLRELLRREHEAGNQTTNTSSFDIAKLQKNIDDWTEQEYTSLSHRPSTPTIRGRSKHIPAEYLTTTTPTPRQSKTTKGFDTSELPTSINNLEPLISRSRSQEGFLYAPVDSNHLIEYHQQQTDSSRRRTTTSTSTTTSAPPTTATPKTTTQFIPYYLRAISNAEPAELWQRGKISISPQTKEKVYVVTPQPRFYPQHALATSTEAPTIANVSRFKSPRFLVRPAPGNGIIAPKDSNSTPSSSSLYAPELFGLMGLSAYVPDEPVEIIDGNSKDKTKLRILPNLLMGLE